MTKITLEANVEGLRWIGLSDFLRDVAQTAGVDIIIDSKKHFLMEKINFVVRGEQERVRWFRKVVQKTIDAHNG